MASISFNDRFKNKKKHIGKHGIIQVEVSNAVIKGIIPESKLHKLYPSATRNSSKNQDFSLQKSNSACRSQERSMKSYQSLMIIKRNGKDNIKTDRSPLYMPPIKSQKSLEKLQLDPYGSIRKSVDKSCMTETNKKEETYDRTFSLIRLKSKLLPSNLKSSRLRITAQNNNKLKNLTNLRSKLNLIDWNKE